VAFALLSWWGRRWLSFVAENWVGTMRQLWLAIYSLWLIVCWLPLLRSLMALSLMVHSIIKRRGCFSPSL
jgi:hypothetical protein